MLQRTRILRAAAMAALLLSTLSSGAYAAKAPDPEPVYFCIVIAGHVVCVPIN